MSFLSRILARRRSAARPSALQPTFRAASPPISTATASGTALARPGRHPRHPRSPIDYAFNPDRQVWQPQPRPVSPILPIQADAHRQQRLLQHQRDHRLRHQASTGDLERIVYFMSSPTAPTFSSTSLPPPPHCHEQPLRRLQSRDTLAPRRPVPAEHVVALGRDPSRTPSPLSTLESFDVGSLLIEGPAGSVASAADGSSSEDAPTPYQARIRAPFDQGQHAESLPRDTTRPSLQHVASSQVLPYMPRQVDQEEYVESPHEQAPPRQPQNGFSLPDQVEYLSDDSGSEYEDETDRQEPQGLEQFSRGSKQPLQSPSAAIATKSTGRSLVDENEDAGDKTHRQVQHMAHHQVQHHGQSGLAYHGSDDDYEDDEVTYGDDTLSELSSYSAAAAAFPLAMSTIGLAATIDEDGSAMNQARTEEPGEGSTTALSPPPRPSASGTGQRWTSTSHYDRASSNVMDFSVDAGSSRDGSQSRLPGVDEDLGRASWVSNVSSYYGSPENAR
ncbi:hypothetical protein MN608_11226 [Microdochium nivale]|nr:hypothetical protein MN608_11226 [Microdochium nivale]